MIGWKYNMSDRDKDNKSENKKDADEERTFTEGVRDGFVETAMNPFRWGRKFLTGKDDI